MNIFRYGDLFHKNIRSIEVVIIAKVSVLTPLLAKPLTT